MMRATLQNKSDRKKKNIAPTRLIVANDKQHKEYTDGEQGKGRFTKKAAHGEVCSNTVFIQKSMRLR